MKSGKIVFIIFIIIGLLFLGLGIALPSFMSNGEEIKTTAVITKINYYGKTNGSSNYEVFVEYKIDDEVYEARLNEYSSDFYEGKEIEIYYNEDAPYDIHSDIPKEVLFIIFVFIGAVFSIIGVVGVIYICKSEKTRDQLKLTGELMYADYKGVDINTRIMINGRCPYNIICELTNPTDGNKYLLRSENIWENPEYIIKEKGITTFPVYVSKKSFKKYAIDISSIKE